MIATTAAHKRPRTTILRWVLPSALYMEWFIVSLVAGQVGAASPTGGQFTRRRRLRASTGDAEVT
jgi:hypothetical protein